MPNAVQFEPILHPIYSAILLHVAESKGLSRTSLCAPEQLRKLEGRQNPRWFASLLMKILREREGQLPSIGFECGHLLDLSSAGVIGQAVMTAPTLGRAFDLLCRYYTLSGLLLHVHRVRVGDEIHISFDTAYEQIPEPVRIFIFEALLSSWRDSSRVLIGDPLPAKRLSFDYRAPANCSIYKEILQCPLQFGAAQNVLVVEASVASLPVITANAVVHERALAHCEAALERQGRMVSLADLVRKRLKALPSLAQVNLESTARLLHLSPRTLNRRLSHEESSFKWLLDEIRCERACRQLVNNVCSIDHIAEQLGYSDPSNFRRAFKKWTGETPGDYRTNHIN